MIWLGTCPHNPIVKGLLDAHEIGLLSQPTTHLAKSGWVWAADNGCYTSSGTWNESRWIRWLEKPHPKVGCLFATVPDVVGDHSGTMIRWRKYSSFVRELGYRVAFVAQDGADIKNIPWDELDCLFIGGTDSFKLGMGSGLLANAARERNKWVHLGRANSLKRLKAWAGMADSADGTYITFGPDINARKVAGWMEEMRSLLRSRAEQPTLL